jgi:hypothetical protein
VLGIVDRTLKEIRAARRKRSDINGSDRVSQQVVERAGRGNTKGA